MKAGARPTGALMALQPLTPQASLPAPTGLVVQTVGPLSLRPEYHMVFRQGLTSLKRDLSFLV